MNRRSAAAALILALLAAACSEAPREPFIEVWHGVHQRVGHLGGAQDDFNLMGTVFSAAPVASLAYSLNGGSPVSLTIGEGEFGFRRLARAGHFNADIPISELKTGANSVVLSAIDETGYEFTQAVTIDRLTGSTPLPFEIRWSEVDDPQDVGQYVDGRWILTEAGLRTQHTGYDRVFLIGERSWRDYEVTATLTVHSVDARTSSVSGGNGVGTILRFAGHVIGGPREFPEAQPKWGYQPFGAIAWLRWEKDKSDQPPWKQFNRGDNDHQANHGPFPLERGRPYRMRLTCRTLPDDPSGAGVTLYSFKIWAESEPEPASWDWEETQRSIDALRTGGVALVAHHVDATFGDLTVSPLR